MGGQVEAFASVVNAYYREGMNKIDEIPRLLSEKDLPNYIIGVHALKSSSAAIGAAAMSTLFRELEFAGRAENIEFIEGHTAGVLESFGEVLTVVRNYLTEKGLFESDDSQAEPEGEEVQFDDSIIDELIDSLTKFNIKACEDRVAECVQTNYGHDINSVFHDVKMSLEVFDYHKAKDQLTELKRRRNESGL